jgi:cobaltochelatase CobN
MAPGPARTAGLPAVAVLVHRHHFVDGSTGWLDAWLRTFRQQGLFAYAAFGQQVTAQTLAEVLELPASAGSGPGRLHASALVLHQLVPQAAALQPLLARWGVPLLGTQPYRAGDAAAWEASDTGLSLSDVPFYLAQPEAAGAIDPVLVAAHGAEGQDFRLIERQAQAVAAKARRLIALQTKPAADKRLVAMVYNYPPGGTNFGASFLNVPRSLEQVSGGLARRATARSACPSRAGSTGSSRCSPPITPAPMCARCCKAARPPRCHWRVMSSTWPPCQRPCASA